MYDILPYTHQKANELGVIVRSSKNPKYKIDVYDKNGNYLFSGGASGYKDYPHYIKEKGIKYANERRRLYQIRHQKDIKILGSKGSIINHLLW